MRARRGRRCAARASSPPRRTWRRPRRPRRRGSRSARGPLSGSLGAAHSGRLSRCRAVDRRVDAKRSPPSRRAARPGKAEARRGASPVRPPRPVCAVRSEKELQQLKHGAGREDSCRRSRGGSDENGGTPDGIAMAKAPRQGKLGLGDGIADEGDNVCELKRIESWLFVQPTLDEPRPAPRRRGPARLPHLHPSPTHTTPANTCP